MKNKITITLILFSILCSSMVFAETIYQFDNCGATGKTGPSSCPYTSTNLESLVSVSGGIQYWTVPSAGLYSIEGYGASGGAGQRPGGLGARIKGSFDLTQGTVLKILVGQEGSVGTGSPAMGAGGGGTFVTTNSNTPLIVAGAGGGGGGVWRSTLTSYFDGGHGSTGTSGTYGGGGSNGQGGVCVGSNCLAISSAGFYGHGSVRFGGGGYYEIPYAFVSGGRGGYWNNWAPNSQGGFGGGGAAGLAAGGGGGYSGGGTEGTWPGDSRAGGGGSYNSGTIQINSAGINSGHGRVIITSIAEVVSAQDVTQITEEWTLDEAILDEVVTTLENYQ